MKYIIKRTIQWHYWKGGKTNPWTQFIRDATKFDSVEEAQAALKIILVGDPGAFIYRLADNEKVSEENPYEAYERAMRGI